MRTTALLLLLTLLALLCAPVLVAAEVPPPITDLEETVAHPTLGDVQSYCLAHGGATIHPATQAEVDAVADKVDCHILPGFRFVYIHPRGSHDIMVVAGAPADEHLVVLASPQFVLGVSQLDHTKPLVDAAGALAPEKLPPGVAAIPGHDGAYTAEHKVFDRMVQYMTGMRARDGYRVVAINFVLSRRTVVDKDCYPPDPKVPFAVRSPDHGQTVIVIIQRTDLGPIPDAAQMLDDPSDMLEADPAAPAGAGPDGGASSTGPNMTPCAPVRRSHDL